MVGLPCKNAESKEMSRRTHALPFVKGMKALAGVEVKALKKYDTVIECGLCGSKFNTKRGLSIHMGRMHGDVKRVKRSHS